MSGLGLTTDGMEAHSTGIMTIYTPRAPTASAGHCRRNEITAGYTALWFPDSWGSTTGKGTG